MGEYLRTTHEVSLSNLNPALLSAIHVHIEKYELGNIDTSALICCETISTRQKKGIFGSRTETILAGVILTARWLIWATRKENDLPSVLSVRLRDIQAQDYERSSMHKIVQDTGINISGLRTDATDVGSTFIGLGTEPAAGKFRTLLKEAIANA